MFIAVKCAGVLFIVIAYWCPFHKIAAVTVKCAVIFQHICLYYNVIHQLCADCGLSAVDNACKCRQLSHSGNQIRRIRTAVSAVSFAFLFVVFQYRSAKRNIHLPYRIKIPAVKVTLHAKGTFRKHCSAAITCCRALQVVAVCYCTVIIPAHAPYIAAAAAADFACVIAVFYCAATVIIPAHATCTVATDCTCIIAVCYCTVIIPAHATCSAAAADFACVIAVFYCAATVIIPAHATCTVATDCTCIIAVCYCTVIIPAHATCSAAAADCACIIAVCYCAVVIIPAHAAYIAFAADGAGVVAVFYGAAITRPAHAACSAAADIAGVVAVFYGAAIHPAHAAHIVVAADIAADIAGVVAVFYSADIIIPPAHAAYIFVAADAADVPAVFYSVITIPPAHAADTVAAADIAGVVAVFYGGTHIIPPAHAADIVAAADLAGVVAVSYPAVIIISAHAADTVAAADIAGVVAVFDGAIIIPAHAAYIFVAADIAVHNAHVLYHADCAHIAEQANIIGFIIEIQPGNGVVFPVKCAGVSLVSSITITAYWRPCFKTAAIINECAVFIQHVIINCNVCRQHRPCVCVCLDSSTISIRQCAVDQSREPVKLCGCSDFVRVSFRTIARCWLCCRNPPCVHWCGNHRCCRAHAGGNIALFSAAYRAVVIYFALDAFCVAYALRLCFSFLFSKA